MFTAINGFIAYVSVVPSAEPGHDGLFVIFGFGGLVAQCSLDGKTISFVPFSPGAAGQECQITDALAVFAPDRKSMHDPTVPRYGFIIAPQDKL